MTRRGARTCSRTAHRATIGATIAALFAVFVPLQAQEPVVSPDSVRTAVDSPPQAAPPRAPVRLAFVGDVNLGTVTFPQGIPTDSARSLLDSARTALRGDLVVINYEGVLADTGAALKCLARPARSRRGPGRRRTTQPPAMRPNCFAFRGPAVLAQALRPAGVTHANLANNHALDFGDAGLAATIVNLESAGIRTYGPAGRIAVDTIVGADGARTIVGLIGFTTYAFAPDLRDITASAALADSVRPHVDLLIATFHGGAEGARALHVPDSAEFLGREPRGELRRWARAMADAGADLIVGHGPHVLRGMEWRGRTLIAYSLGNFATYRGFNIRGVTGVTAVLQAEFGVDGSLSRAVLLPFRQTTAGRPAPDATGEAIRLVRDLSRTDFGGTAAELQDDGTIMPRGAPDE